MTYRYPAAPLRLALATVVLLLAGCRTYGGHYDDHLLYEEIQKANQTFADELARRQADLQALQQAAGTQPALARYAEQYQAAVLAHEAALGDARSIAAGLEGEGDYRQLRRALGAVVMNERAITGLYNDILRSMAASSDSMLVRERYDEPASRYFVVPPYYQRIRFAGERLGRTTDIRGTVAAAARPDTTGAADSTGVAPAAPAETR